MTFPVTHSDSAPSAPTVGDYQRVMALGSRKDGSDNLSHAVARAEGL